MAVNKNQEREAREARERLKLYNARQAVHETQVKRRKRDNVIAVISAVAIIALAATAQFFYFSAGPGLPVPVPTATETPSAEGNIGDVPSIEVSEFRTWTGQLTLNQTVLDIELDGAAAPQGVAAFVTDVQNDYYVGKNCHRLVQDPNTGLLQCGSENGDGLSDPSLYSYGPIENAPSDGIYAAGTIAIARTDGAYGNGHQFFITFEDSNLPDPTGYTVIGKITSGLEELKANIVAGGIVAGSSATDGSPTTPTWIVSVTIE